MVTSGEGGSEDRIEDIVEQIMFQYECARI